MPKILIISKLRIRPRPRTRSINLLSITFHPSPILSKTCSSRATLTTLCWMKWKMTVLQIQMLPPCRIAWSLLPDHLAASLLVLKSSVRTQLPHSMLTTMRLPLTKSLTRTTILLTTFWPCFWALTTKPILRIKIHPIKLSNNPKRWMLLIKIFFRELTLRKHNTLLLLRAIKYLLSSELIIAWQKAQTTYPWMFDDFENDLYIEV